MERLLLTCARGARAICVVVGCLLAALALPRDASAQKEAFIDELIAFRTSLAGTYGDEGRQVTASLDRLAASLMVWDRAMEATEADLRAALPGAPPEQALRVRTTLASLFLDGGRLAEALAEIDAAIAVDPDRAAFHLLRGLAHEAAGAPAEAVEDFRRAWVLDPADPIKAYLLADRGLAFARLDDPSPQIEALLAAQDAAIGAARISFIRLTLIEDSAADWPVFSPAAYEEGFARIAEGRYADAVASFRAAVAQDPLVVDSTSGTGRMAQGISSLREQRFAAAIEHLEAAVASAPGSSEAHRMLGVAYGADGRHAEGIEPLHAAVRLAPQDERARLALGRALRDARRGEEAEQALRSAIDALPALAEARWLLADLYEQRGDGPDAIRELDAATAFPMLAGKGQLYWRLADLSHRHQDFEGVTRALAERARLDPNNAIVHKDLGLAHMRRGARQDALIALVLASLLGPEDPETLASIGQIHLESGRFERAEGVLRRAIALAPQSAQARFALGTTLVRLGRAAEGRAHLAEFQRLRNEELEEQRRTFAFETLRRDAELHTEEGRHELAAGIWEQVVALEPGEPAHRIALSDALMRAGHLESAAGHLEEAAAMDAGPGVYRQLAALYGQLGRAEDSARAQATYERLLGERPATPDAAR